MPPPNQRRFARPRGDRYLLPVASPWSDLDHSQNSQGHCRHDGGAMASRSFDQLVISYSAEVRTLARRSRRFIRELIPKIEETVDTSGPYVYYGFESGDNGIVTYVTVRNTRENRGVGD